MNVARVANTAGVWLARVEGDEIIPVAREEPAPGRDVLRDLLSNGCDIRSLDPVAPGGHVGEYTFLAPIASPTKIVAIGLNYRDHAREANLPIPDAPLLFLKSPNTIIGPGDTIRYDQRHSQQVDYEAELAVVVGHRARDVQPEDGLGPVFGYTVANDISARDAQFNDGQWARGKCFDTFCPLGPSIVTQDSVPDVQALTIRCRVNGDVVQEASTGEMIFTVADVISYISTFMTLEPGDLILTGTPAGVGFARQPPTFLRDGDSLETEIQGIGTLRNSVVAAGDPRPPVR